MDNVVEKIQKLLAKATSNNENEARAALLKARELMARYKVSEQDIEKKDDEIHRAEYSEEECTPGKNTWFVVLSHIIAKNHCCAMVWVRHKNKKQYIGFIGLGNDPEAAREIFGYAVRFIHRKVEDICWNTTAKIDPAQWEESYGMGFASGLSTQYKNQFRGDEQDLALALVEPSQVTSYIKEIKQTSFNYDKERLNKIAVLSGFLEGIMFKPRKELPEGDEFA